MNASTLNIGGMDMRSYPLVLLAGAGLLALAGCSSPSAIQGTTVNGCMISPGTACQGAKMVGVELGNVDLSNSNLSNADFSGANLQGANLMNANLTGAKFDEAEMESVYLQGATVTDASWINTNLIHARCPNGDEARNSTCLNPPPPKVTE